MKTIAELADAGLIADEDREALEAVAQRYAVAVTPAVSGAIRSGISRIARSKASCTAIPTACC
jgi:hypothetical protein